MADALATSGLFDGEHPALKMRCASSGVLSLHPRFPLSILIFAALLLRFVGMFLVPLVPEEAYYWMYSQHPSLSYFDHPPMVAWVIGAGTWLFGNNELGVRIAGNLLMIGASGLLYVFGRMWFGRSAGLLAAIMLHVLPVYYGIGFIATMDSSLMFFWMLGMVGVSIALRQNRSWGWYLAGAAMGAAMLSKYTGVLIGAGAVLAVVIHPPWRKHLRSVHPYLASLIGIAVFSPVIIWNARNDWASFRFQFVDRWEEARFSFGFVGAFLLNQLAVATPVLLAGMVMLMIRVCRGRRMLRGRWLISLCFALPLLAVMAQKSFKHEIHINWTAPVYASLMPAMAKLLLMHLRSRRIGADWRGSVRWTAGICAGVNVGLMLFLLVVQPRIYLMSAFGPWRDLAAVIERYEEQIETETGREPLVVASGKYRLASVMAFYRSPLETHARAVDYTTSQWYLDGSSGLGYPYWAEERRWKDSPIIYITDGSRIERINARFDHVEVVYDSGKQYAKRYQIAVCRGLRRSTTASEAD